MNYSEYLQYFKKFVELSDKKKTNELFKLNEQLVEELGSLEASSIRNTADMDYAKLKAKRYTESKVQLTKEELEDVLFTVNHQNMACLFKYLYKQDRLSFDAIKGTLADVYISSDGFDQLFFLPIFKRIKEVDGVVFMTEEDKEMFDNLPEKFVVYRGMREGENIKTRLSFTLSKSTADKFAYRHSTQSEMGVVVSALVNKSDVLAFFKGEDEVLIDPENLGEITIIQDSNGPTNRPYIVVSDTIDGDSELVVLYQASDEETYDNCYQNYNWSDLEEGWTPVLKKAESDASVFESEGKESVVVLSVEINKKYLSEYDKLKQTYTLDIEKAMEEDEDFEEPGIMF